MQELTLFFSWVRLRNERTEEYCSLLPRVTKSNEGRRWLCFLWVQVEHKGIGSVVEALAANRIDSSYLRRENRMEGGLSDVVVCPECPCRLISRRKRGKDSVRGAQPAVTREHPCCHPRAPSCTWFRWHPWQINENRDGDGRESGRGSWVAELFESEPEAAHHALVWLSCLETVRMLDQVERRMSVTTSSSSSKIRTNFAMEVKRSLIMACLVPLQGIWVRGEWKGDWGVEIKVLCI